MGSRVKIDVATWSVVSECFEIQAGELSETVEAIERSIWSIFAQSLKLPVPKVCAFSREEGISLTAAVSSIRLLTASSSLIDHRTKREIQQALDLFNKLKKSLLPPPASPLPVASHLRILHVAREVKTTLDACCLVLINGLTWEQLKPPSQLVD